MTSQPQVRFWYNSHLRNAIGVFGSIFSRFYIAKFGQGGTDIEELHLVPIMYKKYSHAMMTSRDSPQKAAYTQFVESYPRMVFEMTSMARAPARALNQGVKVRNAGDIRQVGYAPVPYNLGMRLTVVARDQTSAMQVVEQIVTYFRPTLSVVNGDNPFTGFEEDILITLESVSMDDSAEELDNTRLVTYDLDFTVGINVWGATTASRVRLDRHLQQQARAGVTTTVTPSGPDGLANVDLNNPISQVRVSFNDAAAYPGFEDVLFTQVIDPNPITATGNADLDPADPYTITTVPGPG